MILFGILFFLISLVGLTNASNMKMFIRDLNDSKEVREEKNWSLGLMTLGIILITISVLLGSNYVVY